MVYLHSVTILSVLIACSMVTAEYRWYVVPQQPVTTTTRLPYSYVKDPYGSRYWRQYRCRESNLQYDCIFSDVSIDTYTRGVRFGHGDARLNNQKNITFKNSIIKKLPDTLLDSFLHVELVNLTSLQIEEIELFALTNGNVRELYMGFNAIRELPKFAFRNMRFLNVLVLDRNNLSSLPEGMLYGTPNITKLSIASNTLERIDDSTFKKSKALQFLTLSNNKLTHIDLSLIPSLFIGNVSFNRITTLSVPLAVVVLDASYNHISTVTGPNNEELAILRLQDNNISDTTFLQHYSGLVDVNLSHNNLEMITYHQFAHMYRLERLYLSNNRLRALNLGPAPIRTLQILDIRHNYLVYVEHNREQFDTLAQLYLDHNSIVTLKLSYNNSFQHLTLTHNDWDCNNLEELFRNINESVVFGSDRICKEEYRLQQHLCCKESDIPYLDRLQQHIRMFSIIEKIIRAEGRCSASDAIISVQNMNNYVILQGGASVLQSNSQLLNEINQLKGEIRGMKHQHSQFEQQVKWLHTDIDYFMSRFRVTNDTLGRPSENLRKVFAHLKNRRTFKEEETANRLLESRSKKQKVEEMEQNNVADQIRLDETRNKNREMKIKIVEMERHVKRLESKKNKIVASSRVTG